ncbi:MAG: hypothetical protein KKA61_00720 [Nanoarchaeota archaeon]|nr:hypothetical protein [Nanoarchaeota archaeon]
MIGKKNKDKLVEKIVLERIRNMAPNVKIALGSKGEFLSKNDLLNEVTKNTPTGKKIIEIQLRYMRALKEGIV